MTRTPAPTPPEVLAPRPAHVGSGTVARALPQRARRTIGHWCFVDLFTPGVGTPDDAVTGIGPHPHCGLQTVTWLTSGALHHTDSLGSTQQVRPGQLNLMTAGAGITHAEAAVQGTDAVHGAQLWLAQPESTRHGAPRFAHHAELPVVHAGPGLELTVVAGALDGERSPAAVDAPAFAGSLTTPGGGGGVVALEPGWEHGVVVLDGHVTLSGGWRGGEVTVSPGELAALGTGLDEVRLEAGPGTTLLVLGGLPPERPLLMWWNFVVRTRREVAEATKAWNDGDPRFGPLPPSPDPRATAPSPPWSDMQESPDTPPTPIDDAPTGH